jgi:hypothetical protein
MEGDNSDTEGKNDNFNPEEEIGITPSVKVS